MNKMKEVKRLLGEQIKEGRPNAKDMVLRWRRFNPEGKPKDCILDTGLSKNTVYKWWNEADEQGS